MRHIKRVAVLHGRSALKTARRALRSSEANLSLEARRVGASLTRATKLPGDCDTARVPNYITATMSDSFIRAFLQEWLWDMSNLILPRGGRRLNGQITTWTRRGYARFLEISSRSTCEEDRRSSEDRCKLSPGESILSLALVVRIFPTLFKVAPVKRILVESIARWDLKIMPNDAYILVETFN